MVHRKTKSAAKPQARLQARPAETSVPGTGVEPVAGSVTPDVAVAAVETPVTPAPATQAATAKVRPARKPSAVDQAVAKHQKVLAEALAEAEAIDYTKALPAKPVKAAKVAKPAKAAKVDKEEKPAKPRKLKLVRDSYAMPEAEYARIGELKKRLAGLGSEVKKSELLRAGVAALAALNDAELKAVMAGVERIKTGRPSKK